MTCELGAAELGKYDRERDEASENAAVCRTGARRTLCPRAQI
jgi:hypothetical protein